ncbi:hypothetical protein HGRIS_009535 [Hohenbuehelia grisea]|uniref:6-methylsalicylate decarboxylase n=1 Tax=Hohenbuehelia grisea TaxID=104357 RepID=A0ABR3J1M9_9AGAR
MLPRYSPLQARAPRIDIHHHVFPAAVLQNRAKSCAAVGWRDAPDAPPWTPAVSLSLMDAAGIDIAILSHPYLSSPRASPDNCSLVRSNNELCAAIRDQHPTRFGFFATLPYLGDSEGACEEIAYALDELKADGVALSSSYGVGRDALYVGDPRFEPVWRELDRRGAVVFLHGAQVASSTPFPHETLGIPITEVPNETFKAAAHLVVTGTKRRYPHVGIILAHFGGSTPWLAPRVAALSRHMGCSLTPDEILADFKTFYFDTALSAYDANLAAMRVFVGPGRMLFGTDFPAVTPEIASWYTKHLEEFYAEDISGLDEILYGTALQLFPRLRQLMNERAVHHQNNVRVAK